MSLKTLKDKKPLSNSEYNRENLWTKENICWRGNLFLYVFCAFSVIAGC